MTGSDAIDTTAVDAAFWARQDVRPEVRRGFSQQKRARRRRSQIAAAVAVTAGVLVLAVPHVGTRGTVGAGTAVCMALIDAAGGQGDLAGCQAEAATMTDAELLALAESFADDGSLTD